MKSGARHGQGDDLNAVHRSPRDVPSSGPGSCCQRKSGSDCHTAEQDVISVRVDCRNERSAEVRVRRVGQTGACGGHARTADLINTGARSGCVIAVHVDVDVIRPADKAGYRYRAWIAVPLSRYPRIIRLLPAASATGVFQALSEVHETVVFVVAPVSSTSLSGDVLLAPLAVFQLALDTTPAVSDSAIGVVLLPAKSMLTAAEARGRMEEEAGRHQPVPRLALRTDIRILRGSGMEWAAI